MTALRPRSFVALLIARALFLTRALDWTYRTADRVRSELVAGLAPDTVLDRFNDIAYANDHSYLPESSSFRARLFPWEDEAIRGFFPKPPAHVLVGGAGGGREALALAALGYYITAFEAAPVLAEALATGTSETKSIAVYRARYEDLPHLEGVAGRRAAALEELPQVDAAVAGWISFSHLRTRELRVRALESLARSTSGPILVSFLGLYDEDRTPSRLGRLRRALPRRQGRGPADVFSVFVGFYHRTNEAEIEGLAHSAGLEIIHRSFDTCDTNWPHVVLRRSAG